MIPSIDIEIPGYRVQEHLSSNGKTTVYRGSRTQDDFPVVLKILDTTTPSIKHLARLRHEFDIIQNLKGDGLLEVLELKHTNGLHALVLSDVGGISLFQEMRLRHFKLIQTLHIFEATCQQLAQLHEQGVIHKDINPSNIVHNPDSGVIQLIDFSIASRLSQENQKATATRFLEGTLPYISPEQTGRMNRNIDYRTDFYSLGITFYQMITGKLPFTVTDPMELVHCHIAHMPKPVNEVKPNIPQPVSRIIAKLMAKNAEDRYQSAFGIIADIRLCCEELETKGTISPFTVGEQDLLNTFRIPQKLYGREEALATLDRTIDRVTKGSNELLLISGHSGAGKSALINEIYKPMAEYRGYLITGKFDPYQRNTPYTSLLQACRELIRQLLSESDDHLAFWKDRILKEMGPSASVMVEVVPELSAIVGTIPKPPPLPSAETENRFHLAVRKFLAQFSGQGRPLVLVFDDLQWADLATLTLMRVLITDNEISSLLLIGTYRDEEVDSEHPVSRFIHQLKLEYVTTQTLFLNKLSREQVTHLVADTLHHTPEKVESLAHCVYSKTDGNPFFVGEYLKSLYDDQLISFDPQTSSWVWQQQKIQRLSMSQDAVDFMTDKIRKLPERTRHLLTLASCIGNHFTLGTLAQLHERPIPETMMDLWLATKEGLIMPLGDTSSLITLEDFPTAAEMTFDFLHDQVQQAAYSLLDEGDKAHVHLCIGRMMLQDKSEDELDEHVFDIVNHLNMGLQLLEHPSEIVTLVQLNTIAGRKARVAGAYEPAINFLTTGLELLGNEPWQLYDLAMPLSMELAECHYLKGHTGKAEQLFDEAQENALSELEAAAIYQTRTVLYAHLGKYVEAIEVGIEGLSLFGIDVPYMDDALRAAIGETLQSLRKKMGKRTPADLLSLPKLTDPIVYAAINQLINLWSPASNVNLNLMKLIVLKIVDLSLTHGNVDVSSYGYVGYALVLGSGFGDYRTGEAFGELGLKLNDQFCNLELKCRVYFVHAALVKPWRTHLRESSPLLSEAYEAGLESGDIMWASLCLVHMVIHRTIAGDPLKSVQAEAETCLSFLKKARYEQSVEILEVILRAVAILRDPGMELTAFDETEFLTRNQRKLYLVAVNHYYTLKAQTAYLFGEYEKALIAAQRAEQLELYKFAWPSLAEQVMFKGLIHAALWHRTAGTTAEEHLSKLNECLKRLQVWAHECPDNFRSRYLLLSAEAARVTNNFEKALDYFDEAIECARRNEFTHIEALANERAARFLLHKGKAKLARTYLQDGYFQYASWDATAKTEKLRTEFPEITLKEASSNNLNLVDGATTTQDSVGALDMTTIMKASLAISSEIRLERLLTKLMQILMENAGAQKGYLLLEKDGQLYLEASGSVDGEGVSVLQSIPLEECRHFSRAIVNYVHHAREVVVLGNAAKEGHLTSDPYIVSTQANSLLCQPVMYKGKLAGILYLENNLVSGAFTPYRLEILQMLTSEAAISIENARLYADLQATGERLKQSNEQLEDANRNLEQKVEERTSELKEKNDKLAETLVQVKDMQQQIIQQEKMASLGTLSAGIAHEIRNPLNFVNNFAAISQELLEEIKEELDTMELTEKRQGDMDLLLSDLNKNLGKIHDHGKRADDIVHSMLMHSHRKASVKPEPSDVNAILEKFVNLAYHSMRAKNPFSVTIHREFESDLQEIDTIPQDLGRVFLNLINNAFDSMRARAQGEGSTYHPELKVSTKNLEHDVEIRIRDNGQGIPREILDSIFNPFFTTKPAGQGTGLGLSISYDIVVKEHQGTITAHSEIGCYTEFVICLPKRLYKPMPN